VEEDRDKRPGHGRLNDQEIIVRLKLLLYFCAGVIFFLTTALAYRAPAYRSVLEPQRRPSGHPAFDVTVYFFQFLGNPFVLLAFSMAWTYVAITKRGESSSWVCAFLVGCYVPNLLFHSLLNWI